MIIRKAIMDDAEQIYKLIELHAIQGKLLHRTKNSIYEHIQCFYVAVKENEVIGAASLHILDYDLSEIRSLVVSPDVLRKGIGKKLVNIIIEEASKLKIPKLISLTYEETFFHMCGFEVVQKESLPQKMWKDCIHCPKLLSCDEIAMIKIVC